MHYGLHRERHHLREDSDRIRGAARAPAAGRLSVVMPVRNALPYLDEAIRSILGQSHGDFEFVIGDDASDDGSTEALRGWAARDGRIRLFERRDRLGRAASSNWVVGQASGQLIARMDADDIAHPDRLSRQLAALAARPDAALVGSPPVGIDGTGRLVRAQVRWTIGDGGFSAPFAHGSILFRRAAFDKAGGYRLQCAYWEDIDLYLRLARFGAILVLPDPLYFYRFADTSTRLTSNPEEVERAVALMLRCRARYLRGEDYRGLLDAAGPPPAGRIDPLVFLSIAGGRIWTGASPAMAGRMLRRAAFPASREAALAWLIMLWGSLSPRSLRALMRRRLDARNRRAAGRFVDGSVYEWRAAPAPEPAAAACNS
jgi:GT2 family glycosyltransferase